MNESGEYEKRRVPEKEKPIEVRVSVNERTDMW